MRNSDRAGLSSDKKTERKILKKIVYRGSPVRFVLLSRVNTSFSSYFKVCTTVYTPEEKRLVTLSQGCHLVFLVFIQTFLGVKHLSNGSHLLSVYRRNNPRGRTREKVFHHKRGKDLQPVRVFYSFINHKMNMCALCECFSLFFSNRHQIDKVVMVYRFNGS